MAEASSGIVFLISTHPVVLWPCMQTEVEVPFLMWTSQEGEPKGAPEEGGIFFHLGPPNSTELGWTLLY